MNYLDEVIGQINRLPAVNDHERIVKIEHEINEIKSAFAALLAKLAEKIEEPEKAPQ